MTTSPLPRTSPEAQGIPSAAIAEFVARAGQTIQHLHSLMLLRHGSVVAEGWWHPYRPEAPHMLFSLSKSFTSTAVGLAVAEERLDIETPVLAFFPADAPRKVSPHLAAMKVRHLLTMTTGHDHDSTEATFTKRNPYKAFLAVPVVHEPGTHFVYDTAASFMLSAIVQQCTGQTLLAYLTSRLFEPLGIQGAAWESHPNGVNFGGWGLNIKTEDIARFGQLYLQKGQWQGRQIVPAAWVEQATAKQVPNGPDANSDWAQGYGYQFWRCTPPGAYRADGAFGQFCVILPEQDAVLVTTAGVADNAAVLRLAWETLLPAMGPAALRADAPAAEALAQTLQGLSIPPPQGSVSSPLAERISGKTYTFAPNPERLHSLRFNFAADSLTYRLLGGRARRGKHSLTFGRCAWVEGTASLAAPAPCKVAASGTWTAEDTFTLTLCQTETPFMVTLAFTFHGDEVTLNAKVNVAFGPTEFPALLGKAAPERGQK